MSAGPGPAAQQPTTAGTLLDGRVAYRQGLDAYRTGLEPVLLAACIPASPGERVVEGGTGAGAGLLCLAARISRLEGVGLEIDPAQAALATENLRANGHGPGEGGLRVCVEDVTTWTPNASFDHAFANPPWHEQGSTQSPHPGRRLAKVAPPDLLALWAARLAAGLRRRGTLSLLLPAAALSQGACALRGAGCPEITILPLWAHAGRPARLVILRGTRDGRGADRMLPGLTLHEPDGRYTPAAEAILRHAQPLDFDR